LLDQKRRIMLVSFTQTYGNNRGALLDIYGKDKKLQEFKNYFDLNIYSFHNVDASIVDKFRSINKVKNTKELILQNIPYTETIKILKAYLKNKGCTHFFWSQDDTFSADNDNLDFNELINYVKSYKENFLLCLSKESVALNKNFNKIAIKKNTFGVYEYTSLDFRKMELLYDNDDDFSQNLWWAFDDTPYICTYDLFEEIYDDVYFTKKDVWSGEFYLKTKYCAKSIPRYVTDNVYFQNYNILGRTLSKKDKFLFKLKQKKLL
jgi:hypothetical protein